VKRTRRQLQVYGIYSYEKYKIAAVLMIIHGSFMELGGIFAMIPALLIGADTYDIGQYFGDKKIMEFGGEKP